MTNLASALKAEISRLAKKENKDEIKRLKSAATGQRSEIAALKKRLQAVEQQVRKLLRSTSKDTKPAVENEATKYRFSAAGLVSHRKRVGLSAEEYGLLVNASGQSVYKWESGKVRPRQKQLSALSSIRSMGKREAAAAVQTARSR